MTRSLVPFWAASLSGREVTFDRAAQTATIDGVLYSTGEPVPEATIARSSSSTGQRYVFTISLSEAAKSNLSINLMISETGKILPDTHPNFATIQTGRDTIDFTIERRFTGYVSGSITVKIIAGIGYGVGRPDLITLNSEDGSQILAHLHIEAVKSEITEGENAEWWIVSDRQVDEELRTRTLITSTVGDYSGHPESFFKNIRPDSPMNRIKIDTFIPDDQTEEPDGVVRAQLEIDDHRDYLLGEPSFADIKIKNAPLVEVSISAVKSPIREGSPAQWWVTGNRVTTQITRVRVTFVKVSGGDYFDLPSGFIAFLLPGAPNNRVMISMPTIDDQMDEPDGIVMATIVAGAGYTIGNASAQLTIQNAALPTISIVPVATPIIEGMPLQWRLQAAEAVNSTVNIRSRITKVSGGDYTTLPLDISRDINRGMTQTLLSVQTRDDTSDQKGGVVRATLVAHTGYKIGTPNSGDIKINDNDQGYIPPGSFNPSESISTTQPTLTVVDLRKLDDQYVLGINDRELRFINGDGTRDTSKPTIGGRNWDGFDITSNRYALYFRGEGVRFYNRLGEEQTSERVAISRSGIDSLKITNTRIIILTDSGNIEFYDRSGVYQSSEQISIRGHDGETEALDIVENRYVVLKPGSIKFIDFSGNFKPEEEVYFKKDEAVVQSGITFRSGGLVVEDDKISLVGENRSTSQSGALEIIALSRIGSGPQPTSKRGVEDYSQRIEFPYIRSQEFETGFARTSTRYVGWRTELRRLEFYDFNGVEQTSERKSVNYSSLTSIISTSNRLLILDYSGNIRFFDHSGNEQTSENITNSLSDCYGLAITSNRYIISSFNKLIFMDHSGMIQQDEEINIGVPTDLNTPATGGWGGLAATSDRYILISSSFSGANRSVVAFFDHSGTEQTSEGFELPPINGWRGIRVTSDRYIIGNFIESELRSYQMR